jgi:hypothetical protein
VTCAALASLFAICTVAFCEEIHYITVVIYVGKREKEWLKRIQKGVLILVLL